CGPGGSIPCDQNLYGPLGARGGGIIWIAGQTINFAGTISANGENSRASTVAYDSDGQPVYSYRSGGGSGGSIYIEGDEVTLDTVSVNGGSGASYTGAGGKGRIAVYYYTSLTSSLTSN